MGTNYYAVPKWNDSKIKSRIIEKVKNNDFDNAIILIEELKEMNRGIHIGKSSCGWKFCFDHNNWKYFKQNKQSIVDFINSSNIKDEYDREITPDEFWKLVESKKDDIDSKEYHTNWDKYNKDVNGHVHPKPSYISNDFWEFYVEDLRFSTSTNFS